MKGVTWLASGLLLALLLVSGVSVGSQLVLSNNLSPVQDLKSISQLSNRALSRVDQSLRAQVISLNNSATVVSTGKVMTDWLSPIANWFGDWWQRFIEAWQSWLGLVPAEPATPTPAMREQIRQELLTELENQGLVNPNLLAGAEATSTRYGIIIAPTTGSSTRDDLVKKSLSQMFADQVDLKFDQSGLSGTVTPIFNDGQRGGDYIFVLTPLR